MFANNKYKFIMDWKLLHICRADATRAHNKWSLFCGKWRHGCDL